MGLFSSIKNIGMDQDHFKKWLFETMGAWECKL